MFLREKLKFGNQSVNLVIISSISLFLLTILYFQSSSNIFNASSHILQLHLNSQDTHLVSSRVLCLIVTAPQNFLTRAKAVHETWAPRCDRYFFVTEYPFNDTTSTIFNFTKEIPILPLENVTAGYYHLTKKSTLAFLFVYEHYLNDFDWFVKADDDTYLLVDHLKIFLHEQNSSEPVTFGYNFKTTVPKGFHSGGGSYVLSRESLRRFYQAHQEPKSNCSKDGGGEDVEVAKCLRTKGVYPGKSLDNEGRERFHPLPFIDHFHGRFPSWLYTLTENPLQSHYNCCSDQSITFHYVSPDQQYLMDFLLYRTRTSSKIKRD